jgi:LmbE family N-acetylglucosaminyl deacetylase
MFATQRIFVLAPHTDDGELGCGATIAKYLKQGKEVFYIAFSTCSRSLPSHMPADTLITECKHATRLLGIPENNLVMFDFEVRRLPASRQEILETLFDLKKKHDPQTILLPAQKDVHQDHQVIYAEGLRAFKECNLLGYELPWNNTQFQPVFFETITAAHLEAKCKALKQYESQSSRVYMNDEFIRSLARLRGVQANTAYAEAFEVYHLVG